MIVDRIYEIVRELNAQGVTILLVEQNANYALDVSARGYVLETGHDRADRHAPTTCATTSASRPPTWERD